MKINDDRSLAGMIPIAIACAVAISYSWTKWQRGPEDSQSVAFVGLDRKRRWATYRSLLRGSRIDDRVVLTIVETIHRRLRRSVMVVVAAMVAVTIATIALVMTRDDSVSPWIPVAIVVLSVGAIALHRWLINRSAKVIDRSQPWPEARRSTARGLRGWPPTTDIGPVDATSHQHDTAAKRNVHCMTTLVHAQRPTDPASTRSPTMVSPNGSPFASHAGPLAVIAGALIAIGQLVMRPYDPKITSGRRRASGSRSAGILMPGLVVLLLAAIGGHERQHHKDGRLATMSAYGVVIGIMMLGGDLWFETSATPRIGFV